MKHDSSLVAETDISITRFAHEWGCGKAIRCNWILKSLIMRKMRPHLSLSSLKEEVTSTVVKDKQILKCFPYHTQTITTKFIIQNLSEIFKINGYISGHNTSLVPQFCEMIKNLHAFHVSYEMNCISVDLVIPRGCTTEANVRAFHVTHEMNWKSAEMAKWITDTLIYFTILSDDECHIPLQYESLLTQVSMCMMLLFLKWHFIHIPLHNYGLYTIQLMD